MPWRKPQRTTASIAGARCATSAWTVPFRLATSHLELWALKIWMTMEPGARNRPTGGFGFLPEWHRAGPGWTTRLGDTLHFTMGAGSMAVATGAGLRDRSMSGRFTRPHWSLGLA